MITIAKQNAHVESLHEHFVAMLPAIRRRAPPAFRGHDPAEREELIAEVVADALIAFGG